jgi:hypothetical protein
MSVASSAESLSDDAMSFAWRGGLDALVAVLDPHPKSTFSPTRRIARLDLNVLHD